MGSTNNTSHKTLIISPPAHSRPAFSVVPLRFAIPYRASHGIIKRMCSDQPKNMLKRRTLRLINQDYYYSEYPYFNTNCNYHFATATHCNMESSKGQNDCREYCSHPKPVETTSAATTKSTNYFYRPAAAESRNPFQHSHYYVNNFQKYYGYQHHFHMSKYDQIQSRRSHFVQTTIPDSGGRSYFDGFPFPRERRNVGQSPTDVYDRSSFRSDREVRDPIFCHYHNLNQPTGQLSYLAPPDLDHGEETNLTTSMVTPNRESFKGRFTTAKPGVDPKSPSCSIRDLGENDIVCGRGAPTLFHQGNKKFRELILQYQSVYLFSKRPDKPRVAWNVLEIVSSNGGRFVRRVKRNHQSIGTVERGATKKSSCYQWEQLNERQAYEKICQSLREGAPELRRRMLGRTKEGEKQEQESNENSKRKDVFQQEKRQTKRTGRIQSQDNGAVRA